MKNDKDNTPIPATDLEPDISNAPLAAEKPAGLDTRVNITVISYRKRITDTDGISVKAVLDGIVRAGILQDDSSEQVKSITFENRKCDKGKEEETIILIE